MAHRHRKQRVRAEPRFVGRAVERDERGVERGLIVGRHAAHGARDLAADVRKRKLHVEAAEGRAAVAQFERLAPALARAGRHDRAAARAACESHFSLDRRPSAAVPDAARDHGVDLEFGSHASISLRQVAPTSAM